MSEESKPMNAEDAAGYDLAAVCTDKAYKVIDEVIAYAKRVEIERAKLCEQHKAAVVNWSHEREDLLDALEIAIVELRSLDDDDGVCTLDEDGLCHTCEAIVMTEHLLDAKGD